MPLLTYGINHKTAPISVREKWNFSTSQTTDALREIQTFTAVNEAVLLSTCNRTEIYTVQENFSAIEQWLRQRPAAADMDLAPYCYHHHGFDAVQHLMRVASGLDSMVLGEPQIFGQIKQAYQLACDAGTVGERLRHIFPTTFAASKEIRNNTAISQHAVSLAYIIIQLAKRIFASLEQCRVLLVGTGEMMELVATHLKSQSIKQMTIASRSIEKANHLAAPFNGHSIRIGDIPLYMKDIDIVISATASQLPILGKGMMESALKSKKHRPVLMVDLAVPRDIEPEVAQLEDVYLYNIDDLQTLISQNMKNREAAAKQAETMVKIQAEHSLRQLRILDAGDIISDYREQINKLRDQEYKKALEQLQCGQNPEDILKNMVRNLSNKIMHTPTTQLRQAAYDNQTDILLLAKKLFGL